MSWLAVETVTGWPVGCKARLRGLDFGPAQAGLVGGAAAFRRGFNRQQANHTTIPR